MTAETQDQLEELDQLKSVASRHGTSIAIAVGVLVIGLLAGFFVRGRSQASERDAMSLLNTARSAADLETIADQYSSSKVAPLALLRLAKVYYDSGNYGLAIQKYDDFSNTYAEHPFAAAATLGKTHCFEAQGRYSDALAKYRNFAQSEPRHFLTPQAVFGEGRCLEGLWQLDDARIVYETFIAEHPESPWLDRVEDMLASVNRKIDRAGEPPAPEHFPPVSVPVAPQLPELSF